MALGDETTRRDRRGKKVKHRQNVQAQNGNNYVDVNEYVSQAALEEVDAQNKRLKKALKYVDNDSVPHDYKAEFMTQRHPHIHARIVEGLPMHVNKDEPQLARIIWYNELDERHTFDRRNKHASMGCALVRFAIYNDPPKEIPKIMLLYTKACQEHIDTPHISQERDLFLREWMKPESDDIFTFSHMDMQRLSRQFGALKDKLARETPEKKNVEMGDIDKNKMSLDEQLDPYKLLGDSLATWVQDDDNGATVEERGATWLDRLVKQAVDGCYRLALDDPSEENIDRAFQILGISDAVITDRQVDALLTTMGELNMK